jgi:uncharacterized protein YecE (DUF72 family)
MTQKEGQLYVGTSGWSYGWQEFYPADLPSREYLQYYSGQFRTVEINYSFYHLPRPSTYEKWAAQTPDGFVFAVKLSRFITHVKRLSGVEVEVEKFLSNASTLGPKLGPLLVQLPPSLNINCDLLEGFLAAVQDVRKACRISGAPRLAFEFRHPSWFSPSGVEGVVKTLRSHGAAFAMAHSGRYPYPETEPITADFVYLRFHGPDRMFASLYGAERLSRWVPGIRRWLREGLDVYVYFNNDVNAFAVSDAREILALTRAQE